MNAVASAFTRRSARRAVLRRATPLCGRHGLAIDESYSDAFLSRQAGVSGYIPGDLTGHVLEVCGRTAARRPQPLLADRAGESIQRVTLQDVQAVEGRFDAVVCALSLQYATSLKESVVALGQLLQPGGILLATLPCISPLDSRANDDPPVFWRPTALGLRRLAEAAFPADAVTVQSFGNLRTATGHLYGLTASDLRRSERELHDPDFPVVVALRAALPRSDGHSS